MILQGSYSILYFRMMLLILFAYFLVVQWSAVKKVGTCARPVALGNWHCANLTESEGRS